MADTAMDDGPITASRRRPSLHRGSLQAAASTRTDLRRIASTGGLRRIRLAASRLLAIARAARRAWRDAPSVVALARMRRRLPASQQGRGRIGSTRARGPVTPLIAEVRGQDRADLIMRRPRELRQAGVAQLLVWPKSGQDALPALRPARVSAFRMPQAVRQLSNPIIQPLRQAVPNTNRRVALERYFLATHSMVRPDGRLHRRVTGRIASPKDVTVLSVSGNQSVPAPILPVHRWLGPVLSPAANRLPMAPMAPVAAQQRTFSMSMQPNQVEPMSEKHDGGGSAEENGRISTFYLDGAAMGRWMTGFLEGEVNRPHAGMTAVDPRLSPTFAGPPIGL